MGAQTGLTSAMTRTLEPQEREHLGALRRDFMRQIAAVVAGLLGVVFVVVLILGGAENIPLRFKLLPSIMVGALAVLVWILRQRIARLSRDLEHNAVYQLEGTLQGKQWSRWLGFTKTYELRVDGEKFQVAQEQFSTAEQGTKCTIDYIPASRLALCVNGLKRWPHPN